jgi:glycerophosphoryl diester phosphodiesterase
MREAVSPSIIGHRGAAGLVAENTVPSFKAALRHAVDGVELDVYWVHGELWVIHDARVDRTTNGKGRLVDLTRSQLRALDAGGAPIPTLSQVLAVVPQDLLVNIELKGPGTAEPVCRIAEDLDDRSLLISSFDHEALATYRGCGGTAPIGVLSERWRTGLLDTAAQLQAASINLNWRAVTAARARQVHQAGLALMAYTVNRLPTGRRLARLGVDAVFTDRPDRITRAALAL